MEELVTEIQALIVEALALEDIEPGEIEPEAPLFGDGLGLDSIDALELGIAIQKKYGIKIEVTSVDTREHFRSARSLAQFVADSRTA